MEYDITIYEETNGYYYIKIYHHYSIFVSDAKIAKILGISKKFYFDIASQYHGTLTKYDSLYFKNKDDIINFKEWLEDNMDSLLVAKKIEGK